MVVLSPICLRELCRTEYLFPNEVVLRQGSLIKRKASSSFLSSLSAKNRRVLFLTDKPRLFFVDPKTKQVCGEVFWSPRMVVDMKDARNFYVHTVSNSARFSCDDG